MRPSRTVTIVLSAVLLAACAEEAPEMEPPPGQDTEADELAEEPPADDPDGDGTAGAVEAVDLAFAPPSIEVAAGDTVTWTNRDVVAHTVTSGTPGAADGDVDEPLDPEGGTVSVTFDEPGTYAYFCDLHHNMTGEVVVG
jgi:plastocyanin